MKIGQKPDIPPVAAAQAATTGAGASSATASSTAVAAAASASQQATAQSAAQGVPITVSSLARSLEDSNATGTFDAKKVDSVRTAINNGTYKVDPEAIADKLLSNARQVLRKSLS